MRPANPRQELTRNIEDDFHWRREHPEHGSVNKKTFSQFRHFALSIENDPTLIEVVRTGHLPRINPNAFAMGIIIFSERLTEQLGNLRLIHLKFGLFESINRKIWSPSSRLKSSQNCSEKGIFPLVVKSDLVHSHRDNQIQNENKKNSPYFHAIPLPARLF
jgi:hypothetical protein